MSDQRDLEAPEDLRVATHDLIQIEQDILDVFREKRLHEYPPLAERLREARTKYDEACARHFNS